MGEGTKGGEREAGAAGGNAKSGGETRARACTDDGITVVGWCWRCCSTGLNRIQTVSTSELPLSSIPSATFHPPPRRPPPPSPLSLPSNTCFSDFHPMLPFHPSRLAARLSPSVGARFAGTHRMCISPSRENTFVCVSRERARPSVRQRGRRGGEDRRVERRALFWTAGYLLACLSKGIELWQAPPLRFAFSPGDAPHRRFSPASFFSYLDAVERARSLVESQHPRIAASTL